jgi:hypothetical protein
MTTKTLIMAVPWIPARTKRAIELARETGGDIVFDEKHDAMDTWQRVLEQAGDGPVVIIEDDVRLTSNWREKVEAVIAEKPGAVIQFFSIKPSDVELGSRWARGATFSMNQCYYLPARAAKQLLAYLPGWMEGRDGENGYDLLMRAWLTENQTPYWLHVPSLVQHEPWKSELGARSSKRQSPTFETGA